MAKKCNYCDPNRDTGHKLLSIMPLFKVGSNTTDVTLDISEKGLYCRFYFDSNEALHKYIRIKYCPMCGRKLEGESNEKSNT